MRKIALKYGEAGVDDVVQTLLKDGVTDQELADARSGLAQSWRIGRTMDYVAARESKLHDRTRDQVDGALRSHFDTGHLVRFYAGDFAAAAKKEAEGGH